MAKAREKTGTSAEFLYTEAWQGEGDAADSGKPQPLYLPSRVRQAARHTRDQKWGEGAHFFFVCHSGGVVRRCIRAGNRGYLTGVGETLHNVHINLFRVDHIQIDLEIEI